MPAACVRSDAYAASNPRREPAPVPRDVWEPDWATQWDQERRRAGWAPWLSPKVAGLAWGCHCPQQLHLRAPAWARSPALVQREAPRTSHQLLLLRACHHFHTQQGLWGWWLFPDVYLSEERKQGERPRICQISRQERNPGRRPKIRRGEGHPPLLSRDAHRARNLPEWHFCLRTALDPRASVSWSEGSRALIVGSE